MDERLKRERIVIRDGQVISIPMPARDRDRDHADGHGNRPDPHVYDAAGHRIGNDL